MASDWQIVLTADGAVLTVTGGAPTAWIGTRLADRDDVPPELRGAARAVLRELHGSASPMATATVSSSSNDRTIQLLAIEAVPLRRAAVNLRSLLESAVDVMRRQTEAMDVSLTLDVDAAQPHTMFLDPEKVAWAVTALVGNALRYVRRGSRVMPGGLIAIRTSYDEATSEVSIVVQDDGVGIPEDKLLFLFRRAPDRQLTVGLGLMLVSDVVAALGGRIDIQSRTDAVHHGTTVRLTFPVV